MTVSRYSVLQVVSTYQEWVNLGVAVWNDDGRRGACMLDIRDVKAWDRIAGFLELSDAARNNYQRAALGMLAKFLGGGIWVAHEMSSFQWREAHVTITDPSDPSDVARVAEIFLPSSSPVVLA